MTFWKWIAGFWEDQTGKGSAKRIILYWAMGLITYMVIKDATTEVEFNMEIFWGIIGLVVVGMGVAVSEFFKHLPKNGKGN